MFLRDHNLILTWASQGKTSIRAQSTPPLLPHPKNRLPRRVLGYHSQWSRWLRVAREDVEAHAHGVPREAAVGVAVAEGAAVARPLVDIALT